MSLVIIILSYLTSLPLFIFLNIRTKAPLRQSNRPRKQTKRCVFVSSHCVNRQVEKMVGGLGGVIVKDIKLCTEMVRLLIFCIHFVISLELTLSHRSPTKFEEQTTFYVRSPQGFPLSLLPGWKLLRRLLVGFVSTYIQLKYSGSPLPFSLLNFTWNNRWIRKIFWFVTKKGRKNGALFSLGQSKKHNKSRFLRDYRFI